MTQRLMGSVSRSGAAPIARIVREAFKPALRCLAQPSTLLQIPRLFREGWAPARRMVIQAHNEVEISRLLAGGSSLAFISSFPRSGNTWVRYLLSDILQQNTGVATTTELPIRPESLIPDFYCDLMVERDQSIPLPTILIKTHDTFQQLARRLSKETTRSGLLRSCKFVYIYRSAEDSLVSLYHLHRRAPFVKNAAFGMDAFCRGEVAAWMENIGSFLEAAQEGFQTHFVSYEMLLEEPARVLSDMADFLGVKHNPEMVAHAVRNMQFANLRAMEERRESDQEERGFFFRRGKNGAGREELEASTLCDIREKTAPLLALAGRQMKRQKSAPAHSLSTAAASLPVAPATKSSAAAALAGLQTT